MMISPCQGKFRPLFTIIVIVKLVSSNPMVTLSSENTS